MAPGDTHTGANPLPLSLPELRQARAGRGWRPDTGRARVDGVNSRWHTLLGTFSLVGSLGIGCTPQPASNRSSALDASLTDAGQQSMRDASHSDAASDNALEAPPTSTASQVGCMELTATLKGGGEAGGSAATGGPSGGGAVYSHVRASLDDDRGFGTARDLLEVLATPKTVKLDAAGTSTEAGMELTVEFAHNPWPQGDQLWDAWWREDSSKSVDDPERVELLVPVCMLTRTSDDYLVQQWDRTEGDLTVNDGVLVAAAGALATTAPHLRSATGKPCNIIYVDLQFTADADPRARVMITAESFQLCAQWATTPLPKLRRAP